MNGTGARSELTEIRQQIKIIVGLQLKNSSDTSKETTSQANQITNQITNRSLSLTVMLSAGVLAESGLPSVNLNVSSHDGFKLFLITFVLNLVKRGNGDGMDLQRHQEPKAKQTAK